jgi:hypothetical protein
MTRDEWEGAKLNIINHQRKLDRDRTVAQVELNRIWDDLMKQEPLELKDKNE